MIKRAALKEVLKQYRITHWVQDDRTYRQVSISQTGEVTFRGEKSGREIGRKRQFIVDLDKHPNTLIFIRQGVFKGGIGIASAEVNKCLVTENMPMFDIVGIKPGYLSLYLKSPQFKNDINRLVPLGTAQKAIHEKHLLQLELPLPPEEVQDEVIHKIASIMKDEERLSLNTVKSIKLIASLRQAILQEAVSGKLVPQDPKDEPASELLKKIKAEKEKLVREKKTKKEKPLPPISEEEIPFEIPKGWVWVRLGEITAKIGSGSTPLGGRKIYEETGIPFIRSQNVWNTGLELDDVVYITEDIHKKMEGTRVFPGDILLNITGASIGRTCIVPEDFKEGNVSQHVSIVRLISPSITSFTHFFLLSPYLQNKIMDVEVGVSREGLSKKNMELFLVPVPPFSEQNRIIQKLDHLLKLCSDLEETVKENQNNSELLMEAVLKEAFAS